MASNDLMVGLEIGTSKICVVVGEARLDGTTKILGVGQAPSRGVRKGEIVDFETAMKCVVEALSDAETKSDVMGLVFRVSGVSPVGPSTTNKSEVDFDRDDSITMRYYFRYL